MLVGAGPGDPGLITWRGVECLASADAVLYDSLANPRLLDHAPPAAIRISLGRHGKDHVWTQDEINQRLIELARQGLRVVRLKGGDPAVFAHLSEELASLRAAGIRYEIVPGVTAALAGVCYCELPITQRGAASAVAFVTGHEQADKIDPSLDFASLAAFPGTLVVYMGVTTAPVWTAALVAAGKPPSTPAAILRRCTWPDQQLISCTLGTAASVIAESRLRPPVLVVIGEVAALLPSSNWFNSRPLYGQRILVTRPAHQNQALVRPLTELGAECWMQPAIEVLPPADWHPVDEALRRLNNFDWIVFSSANGVRYFLDRLLQTGADLRRIGSARLAVIGPGTAAELARYHLRADLQPDEFRAEALALALRSESSRSPSSEPGQPVQALLVRASRGREVLSEQLQSAGIHVHQIVAYHSRDVETPDPAVEAALRAGQIDWVTVTSSAIARSLHRLFGASLRRTKLASISPVTSATLRELDLPPAAEAQTYTMPGLVDALVRASRGE